MFPTTAPYNGGAAKSHVGSDTNYHHRTAASFVDELTRNEMSSQIHNTLKNAQSEVEKEFGSVNQDIVNSFKSMKVRHNDTFTVSHYVKLEGTIDQLTDNPDKCTWRVPADSAITLPVNSRFIPIETTITTVQNTFPTAIAVTMSEVESNSKWTTSGNKCDYVLNPLMRQPISANYTQFKRQDIDVDYSKIEGWNNVDDETIDREIIEQYPEQGFTEIDPDGLTMRLIQSVLPDLDQPNIGMVERVNEQDGTKKMTVVIASYIVNEAQKLGKKLSRINFGNPNELTVKFAREDGRVFNDSEGLIDAVPGINAFNANVNKNTVYHASLAIQQTFAFYAPHIVD